MKYVYVVVYTNSWDNSQFLEVAFSKKEDAKNYLHNMHLNEEGYRVYNYDIEEVPLDHIH